MKTKSIISLISTLGVGIALAANVATAAPSSRDLRNCQKQLGKQSLSISKFASTQVHGCTEKVVLCELAAEIDSVDSTACLQKAVDKCAKLPVKRTKLMDKVRVKSLDKCAAVDLADIEPYIAGLGLLGQSAACANLAPPLTPIVVASSTDLVDCLIATAWCSAERNVARRDPRAAASLTTAGVGSEFLCVAP